MKRLFAIAVLAAGFAACGGGNNRTDTDTTDSATINSDRPLSDSSLNNSDTSLMNRDTGLQNNPGSNRDTVRAQY